MRYLIYDAALNSLPTLLVLQKYYPVNESLFKGTKDEALMDVAPWLLQVDEELDHHLGKEENVLLQFALLLETRIDIQGLARHLKKFLYQTVEGREYFFRFYDPRVLGKFLPTCDEDQLNELFGPIQYFAAYDTAHGIGGPWWLENGRLKSEQNATFKL